MPLEIGPGCLQTSNRRVNQAQKRICLIFSRLEGEFAHYLHLGMQFHAFLCLPAIILIIVNDYLLIMIYWLLILISTNSIIFIILL